jgi:23S rRNA (cytosine1962-C5)-methyltransferase
MQEKGIVLKSGKEKIFHQKHHWIFSGAIKSFPSNFSEGQILAVFSESNELLGHGYFNSKTSLCGRIVSFGNVDPYEAILENIKSAILLRKELFDETHTNAYRLINGEGDLIPGLIVDKYDEYLVIQISTLGMEKIKPFIVSSLKSLLPVKAIYEKSILPSRKEEDLEPFEGTLMGSIPDEVVVRENGLKFLVSFKKGQKTGFFLDQREMRSLIGTFSNKKRVLNCFCYTGGFSIYALKNNALSVDSIDISKPALDLALKNASLNNLDISSSQFICDDVFKFLKEKPSLNYDLVILDPPSFGKKKKDVVQACKGYKEINKETIKKMKPNSFLLTCSCTYHVDESLFQTVIFQAALEAKRKVKIVTKHRLACDHPINLYHPEGNYLKSLLLFVE